MRGRGRARRLPSMRNHLTLLALVAASAVAPATARATSDTAYAFLEHDGATTVTTVFRTAEALPRRADGSITARAALDGTSGSLATIGHRPRSTRHCYVLRLRVRDGKLPGGRSAAVGSRHTLTLAGGSRSVVVRRQQPRYDVGQPLGC